MMNNQGINIDKIIAPNSWQRVLGEIFARDYMQNLAKFLKEERENHKVFPQKSDVFTAFNKTPFENIRVVILGQDPYHGLNQAHGLSFSVQKGVKTPPSLINIYKELEDDIKGFKIPDHGNLTKWAEQGVFLINTVLTVRAHEAFSHRDKGWESFTDEVIKLISECLDNVVFVLWGAPAKSKIKLIDEKKHLILTSAHPSPLSAYRGFFGCKHFSKINGFLKNKGYAEIDWQV